MTRSKNDPTEIADRIIELIGGGAGLTRLGARRLETVAGGLVFNLENDGYTVAVVVIREIERRRYRIYVAHLDKWVEVRQADDVPPERVRLILGQLIGKKEPA